MKAEEKYLAIENGLYETTILTLNKHQVPPSVAYLIAHSVMGRVADEAVRNSLLREQELENRLTEIYEAKGKNKNEENKPAEGGEDA